jgi:hypothetical protein
MGLISNHPPGRATAWGGQGQVRLGALPVGMVALHAAGAGRLTVRLLRGGTELARAAATGGPGWRWLAIAAAGADALQWDAPTLPLTLAEGRATPALRLWSGPAPEAVWLGATILGPGALMPLGGGPPVPHLRMAPGEVCRITLADAPPEGARPILDTLRGAPPRADRQGRTLVLRAGRAWDGILPGLAAG